MTAPETSDGASRALSVKDVHVSFGGVRALRGVSFDVGSEDILGIIGPNGAGKSTLVKVIGGAQTPTSGDVFFRGRRITDIAQNERCRQGVVQTHQIPRPFLGLTIGENLEVARRFGGPDADASCLHIAEFCRLGSLHKPVDALGPTELRRLELARSLCTDPKVLLLDEVAAGVPEDDLNGLMSLLSDVADRGIRLVVVDHVMELIMGVSQRMLVLREGELIADGTPQEVVNSPSVIEAYFGS